MHALGFWHEQMRPDRDNYVNVYMNNVSPQMRFNFNKLNPAQWNHFGQGEFDKNQQLILIPASSIRYNLGDAIPWDSIQHEWSTNNGRQKDE